jgi:hypothetical protein
LKRKPKFRVGQVVAVTGSESEKSHGTPWYGTIAWEQNSVCEVNFPDGDALEYRVGDLRPLTKRECGT